MCIIDFLLVVLNVISLGVIIKLYAYYRSKKKKIEIIFIFNRFAENLSIPIISLC